jgi:hypothetical protein
MDTGELLPDLEYFLSANQWLDASGGAAKRSANPTTRVQSVAGEIGIERTGCLPKEWHRRMDIDSRLIARQEFSGYYPATSPRPCERRLDCISP